MGRGAACGRSTGCGFVYGWLCSGEQRGAHNLLASLAAGRAHESRKEWRQQREGGAGGAWGLAKQMCAGRQAGGRDPVGERPSRGLGAGGWGLESAGGTRHGCRCRCRQGCRCSQLRAACTAAHLETAGHAIPKVAVRCLPIVGQHPLGTLQVEGGRRTYLVGQAGCGHSSGSSAQAPCLSSRRSLRAGTPQPGTPWPC